MSKRGEPIELGDDGGTLIVRSGGVLYSIGISTTDPRECAIVVMQILPDQCVNVVAQQTWQHTPPCTRLPVAKFAIGDVVDHSGRWPNVIEAAEYRQGVPWYRLRGATKFVRENTLTLIPKVKK